VACSRPALGDVASMDSFVIHDAVEKWQPRWHCGWSAAALLAILLVIGNLEQNPGPPSESAFLNSPCRDGAVRDLECFTADGASQDASTQEKHPRCNTTRLSVGTSSCVIPDLWSCMNQI